MDSLLVTDDENTVDDRGTDQQGARDLVSQVCSDVFDSDLEKAGLALGRDSGSLGKMLKGEETIDDDLVMKAKGIAEQRGDDQ